ncbi:hypothetical protein KI387_041707, partial [Taxus chinensis]
MASGGDSVGGSGRKRPRAQTGPDLGDSFSEWLNGRIKNVAMRGWLEQVWSVAESIEDDEEEVVVCDKLRRLMLDPGQSVGRRNVFDVAQGLSAANIISNSAGQFLLHKEMKDLEARVVSLQFHIHALNSWSESSLSRLGGGGRKPGTLPPGEGQ